MVKRVVGGRPPVSSTSSIRARSRSRSRRRPGRRCGAAAPAQSGMICMSTVEGAAVSPNRRAVYPGTFDPITRGHEDLVRRAAGIFDEVLVAIAESPSKAPLFEVAERVALARDVLAAMGNVQVCSYSRMTVEFETSHGLR